MNKERDLNPDLENMIRRTLKDDLPPDAEARMHRCFHEFKSTHIGSGRAAQPDRWWMRRIIPREFLALASSAMLIMGLLLHFGGDTSAWANSIGQLKMILTVSMSLSRASSMDCTVLIRSSANERSSYRVLWRGGDTRIDRVSDNDAQTIWMTEETISFSGSKAGSEASPVRSAPAGTLDLGPFWQAALEFLNPKVLARNIEESYGLMQSSGYGRPGEYRITGRQGDQVVEISIDSRSYLPQTIKKYSLISSGNAEDRNCMMEVRFDWNRPVPDLLFVPAAGKQLPIRRQP